MLHALIRVPETKVRMHTQNAHECIIMLIYARAQTRSPSAADHTWQKFHVDLWERRFEDHFGVPACHLCRADVIPRFAGGRNALEEYRKNKRARGRRKSRLYALVMRLRGKNIEKIFLLCVRMCVCVPPPGMIPLENYEFSAESLPKI